jgi:hypothetical protein
MVEVEKAAYAGFVACFQDWRAGLGKAGRRAEVAMERERVRGIEREMVRKESIMNVDNLWYLVKMRAWEKVNELGS